MNYAGLSQSQLPETPGGGEYAGFGNPIVKYAPQAGRADRLGANIVGGGEVDRLSSGGYTAASTNIL